MELFKSQLSYINTLESVAYNSLQESIQRYDFVIKDYIINKQLFRKGIDGEGKRLRGYTRMTIRMKIATGRPADRTTLFQEGDFYASVRIDAHEDRFIVSSDVEHASKLVKQYGVDILKPSSDNLKDFITNYFLPSLRKKINDTLTE